MPCCQDLERKSTTVRLMDERHEWMAANLHVTWFRASDPKQTTTALFEAITPTVLVITYRRFGTTYRSHLQGSRVQEALKMGELSCSEKSVRNYHYLLHNIPEDGSTRLTSTLFARSVHNCMLSKGTIGNVLNSCDIGTLNSQMYPPLPRLWFPYYVNRRISQTQHQYCIKICTLGVATCFGLLRGHPLNNNSIKSKTYEMLAHNGIHADLQGT
jgi:hypothetical protein